MKVEKYPARIPQLRVPNSLRDRLDRLADKRQMKLADIHRDILQTFFDSVEKVVPEKERVR